MNIEEGRKHPHWHVEVKCKKCGKETGFFPHLVMNFGGCECGNENYGSPLHWIDGDFGEFEILQEEIITFKRGTS